MGTESSRPTPRRRSSPPRGVPGGIATLSASSLIQESDAIIAAPKHGFVFLAMSKSASTSIEAAFGPFAQVTTGGMPSYKHINYAMFSRYIEPFLAARGHDRSSYEVVCLFRQPIEWLESWWRYRSRPQLAKPTNRNHAQYAGHLSFDQFAEAYMTNSPPARVRPPADFVKTPKGDVGVDRIYRLDDIHLLVEFLNQCVGREVEPPVKNASPPRESTLSEEIRRALRSHMAAEFEIYEHGTVGH